MGFTCAGVRLGAIKEIPDVTRVGCYKLTTVPTCFSCEFLPVSVVSAYPFQLRVPTCFSCESLPVSVASPDLFLSQVPTSFNHKSRPVSVVSPYLFQSQVPTSFSRKSLPLSVVSSSSTLPAEPDFCPRVSSSMWLSVHRDCGDFWGMEAPVHFLFHTALEP